MWSADEIVEAVALRLGARARADDLEQAVYGFDRLDELGLHPLVHEALRAARYGVWPEQRYPDDWVKKRQSEGKRCDVVLTPPPGLHPIRDPLIRGTLFDTPMAVDPEEAYWLEIKSIAQFETSGPFPRYSAEFHSPVTADVKKVWADGAIRFGGLLVILFTADRETGRHDLGVWRDRCLGKGYPVGAPSQRGFEITDRIGNGYCWVALFPVRRGV